MNETNNPSAVRSKTEITQALITLMKKYPYNEITVKQIILEARLARKTFYRNFESKDDVLLSLLRGILREYFDTVNDAKGDMLTTVFEFADRNRDLLFLLDRNDMLYVLLNCVNEYLPFLRNRYLSGNNPTVKLFEGLDEEYLISMNIGAMFNVITLWVHRGMAEPPGEVKQTLYEYLQRLRNYGLG